MNTSKRLFLKCFLLGGGSLAIGSLVINNPRDKLIYYFTKFGIDEIFYIFDRDYELTLTEEKEAAAKQLLINKHDNDSFIYFKSFVIKESTAKFLMLLIGR